MITRDSFVELAQRLCPGGAVERRTPDVIVIVLDRTETMPGGAVSINTKRRCWELGGMDAVHPGKFTLFGQSTGRIPISGEAPFDGRGWRERLITAAWTALVACMTGEIE